MNENKQIPSYIERVLEEKAELDKKLKRLVKFIYSYDTPSAFITLPKEEQRLLKEQLICMQQYSLILDKRLNVAF